jgi:hypothetical protein
MFKILIDFFSFIICALHKMLVLTFYERSFLNLSIFIHFLEEKKRSNVLLHFTLFYIFILTFFSQCVILLILF